MASDVEDGFAAEKDEYDGAEVQNLNSVIENRTEKEEDTGKEAEVQKEEMKEEDEVKKEVEEVTKEVEEEIRMRRHSPRMTLPLQRKKANEKKQDVAGEELRRVSPRFQGGVGKVSKEAEEAKMYLFGLV